MIQARRWLAGILAIIVPACGGGSGGGGAPTPPPSPWASLPQSTAARGFDGGVQTVVPVGDGTGDFYVGGSFTAYNTTSSPRLIRLNSDGTPDTGFSVGLGFDNDVYSVAPARDGSGDVYVVGSFGNFNGTTAGRIVRLNSDGSRDTGFVGGFSSAAFAVAAAVDGSGDIYVGGILGTYVVTGAPRIIRLNSDGSVDTSFVMGGGFNSNVWCITPAQDGSGDLYIGGTFTTYQAAAHGYFIRVNPDGSPDGGFATGTGCTSVVYGIAVAPDGSNDVYVGGGFGGYNGTPASRIIRLNSNGTPDGGFVYGAGFNGTVNAISAVGAGTNDILVCGQYSSYQGTPCSQIIRLHDDGSVDASLSTASQFFFANATGAFVVQDGSSDVYVGGNFTGYGSQGARGLIRLNSDGSRESSFPAGSGFDTSVLSIAPANDGSGDVYVGGSFSTYNRAVKNRLARLNADGTLDVAFDTGGGPTGDVLALAPAVDGSGDVWVGGAFFTYNGVPSSRFTRLNSDGTQDPGFILGSGFNGNVRSVVPAADGSGDAYVGGLFTTYKGAPANGLVRLDADGTPDAVFAIGTGFDAYVDTIALAGDGSGDLYVVGGFSNFNGAPHVGIIRLNSDGTPDPGFVTGTGFSFAPDTLSMALDGSGAVYVGGSFTSYNGTACNRIVRLASNGTVDGSFSTGFGFNSAVLSLSTVADGSQDICVGGFFTSYNAVPYDSFIRLNADGSPDASSPAGAGVILGVHCVVPAPGTTGAVYIGGDFRVFRGTTVDHFVRVASSGLPE